MLVCSWQFVWAEVPTENVPTILENTVASPQPAVTATPVPTPVVLAEEVPAITPEIKTSTVPNEGKVVPVEAEEGAGEEIINEEILGKSEETLTEKTNSNAEKLNTKPTERIILGWVEPISLGEKNLSIDSKLTPGTAGNALHADNIVMVKKPNGTKWVDFDVTDKLGRTVRFHKKVISMREKTDPKKNQYKVTLEFCLNMQHFKLDFMISDRSNFEHPARIGRDSLAGHFIVDPGLTKTSVPSCK